MPGSSSKLDMHLIFLVLLFLVRFLIGNVWEIYMKWVQCIMKHNFLSCRGA